MPEGALDFDVARSIGTQLPDVKGTAGKLGMALKIKGRILACQAIHRTAEPNSLMISIGSDRRDELIEEDPDAFYLTRHYEPYPVVLARLAEISRARLSALLAEAREFTRSQT